MSDPGDVRRIFDRAIEIPPSERGALLDRLCADRPALRRDVDRLLAAYAQFGDIFEPDDTAEPCEFPAVPHGVPRMTEALPKQEIGPYRLLELLGQGGMGEVWLAHQTSPVRREVALKLIKAGMDTAEVVARFQAERQALALMDHPAIAHVFEAGMTPQGRPYFAMEYVRGESITSFAARHRLSVAERIELFIHACEGVQHAHQKGIIHRDLKPSNILVVLRGDKSEPKVIDFGLAKAMTQPLTDLTLHTEFGRWLGTPAYMSPEQAEMKGLDVDTRADVYALGVILYELLTGTLPFDPKALRTEGVEELRHVICNVEPPRPSAKVTALGVAGNGGPLLQASASQLRGDLDAITMKALEKDRIRRYASVGELAADLRRHLEHQPVVARPATATYRVRKFVRRNRLAVGTLVLASVFLVTFALTMALQARRVARERDRANAEAMRANTEAATAKQVSDFLLGLFRVSDPSEARGNQLTAREILDQGAAKIETELANDPAVKARLMALIGDVYFNLGLFRESEVVVRRALEIRTRILGPDNQETLASLNRLATVLASQGRVQEAEQLFRETLTRRRAVLGAEHPETLSAINNLGGVLSLAGRYQDAEPYMREALDIRRRTLGEDAPDSLASMNNLATLLVSIGKFDEAESYARDAFGRSRQIQGQDHPATLGMLCTLGEALHGRQRFAEAEQAFEEALELVGRVLGTGHRTTASCTYSMGAVLLEQGKVKEAETYLSEEFIRSSAGSNSAHLHIQVARLRNAQQRYVDAESGARKALDLIRSQVARGYFMTILAESLAGQGRFSDAESLFTEGYAQLIRSPFDRSDYRRLARTKIIEFYRGRGLIDKADHWAAETQ